MKIIVTNFAFSNFISSSIRGHVSDYLKGLKYKLNDLVERKIKSQDGTFVKKTDRNLTLGEAVSIGRANADLKRGRRKYIA